VISSIRNFDSQVYATSPRQYQRPLPLPEEAKSQPSDAQQAWRAMAVMQIALTQLQGVEKSGVLEPVQ